MKKLFSGRRSLVAGALGVALVAATGCAGVGAQEDEAVPETVTIGFGGAGVIAYAATYVARERGYLDEELEAIGSSAKYVDLEGSVGAVQALATGDVDFTTSVASAALAAVSEGAEMAQVVQFNTTDMVILGATPGLPTDTSDPAAIVEGRTWGIPGYGSTAHMSALSALAAWGYQPEDVEFVTLGHVASSAVAVERGLADYYWLGTVAEELIADGAIEEVLDLFDPATTEEYYGGPYVTAGLFALPSYLKDHPDVADAVVGAHREALQWISDNIDDPQTVMESLPEEMRSEATVALLERFLPGTKADGEVDRDGLQKVVDVSATGGLIKNPDAIDLDAFAPKVG